jgi:hypothetical protein
MADVVSWVCLVLFLAVCVGVPAVGIVRAVCSEPRERGE